MTDLSPATLTVWDRFCGIVEDHGPPRLGLAAALRAAADQIENLYCDSDVEDSPGIVFAMRHFLAIAAELETFTTENR